MKLQLANQSSRRCHVRLARTTQRSTAVPSVKSEPTFKLKKWTDIPGLKARHMSTEIPVVIPSITHPKRLVTANANVVFIATVTKAIIIFRRPVWWRRKEEVELRAFRSVHLLTRNVERSATEYLAAFGEDQFTGPPGPSSFTNTLIWALKTLSTSKGFKTTQLLQSIKDAPNFPLRQNPQLSSAISGNDRITISVDSDAGSQNKTCVLILTCEDNDIPGLRKEVNYRAHHTRYCAS